jgi:hypothetical protein
MSAFFCCGVALSRSAWRSRAHSATSSAMGAAEGPSGPLSEIIRSSASNASILSRRRSMRSWQSAADMIPCSKAPKYRSRALRAPASSWRIDASRRTFPAKAPASSARDRARASPTRAVSAKTAVICSTTASSSASIGSRSPSQTPVPYRDCPGRVPSSSRRIPLRQLRRDTWAETQRGDSTFSGPAAIPPVTRDFHPVRSPIWCDSRPGLLGTAGGAREPPSVRNDGHGRSSGADRRPTPVPLTSSPSERAERGLCWDSRAPSVSRRRSGRFAHAGRSQTVIALGSVAAASGG